MNPQYAKSKPQSEWTERPYIQNSVAAVLSSDGISGTLQAIPLDSLIPTDMPKEEAIDWMEEGIEQATFMRLERVDELLAHEFWCTKRRVLSALARTCRLTRAQIERIMELIDDDPNVLDPLQERAHAISAYDLEKKIKARPRNLS